MSEKVCENCGESNDFYMDEEGKERCCLCEHFSGVEARLEPMPEPLPAVQGLQAPSTVKPEGNDLVLELDHLRIDLKGDWRNGDLQGLLQDFNASREATVEIGKERGSEMDLIITAVRKSVAKKLIESGDLIIPFRDRHGKVIPGRALHLPFNDKGKRN